MKSFIAGALVVLMSIFVLNNIIFIHSHVLPNGRIITHAHPYNWGKDAPLKTTHSHSANEFVHLSHLQILFFTSFLSFLFIASTAVRIATADLLPGEPVVLSSPGGRAPPAGSYLSPVHLR